MRNPYLLETPFVVSFSGGRTSGMMGTKIVESVKREWGGVWPREGRIIFNNTGLELEETLRFVSRCEEYWDVPVTRLEYRNNLIDHKGEERVHWFVEVTHESASRMGEPLEAIIEHRSFLPNVVMRFCTGEAKIRTTNRYIQSLGWETYQNAIGLRYDEPRRVSKMLTPQQYTAYEDTLFGPEAVKVGKKKEIPPGEEPCCPLSEAKVMLADVMAFWKAMPFDLELEQDEGNCYLCFLKGMGKIIRLIKKRPELAAWWVRMEEKIAKAGTATRPETARFRADRPSYAELVDIATGRVPLPLWAGLQDEDTIPCNCTD